VLREELSRLFSYEERHRRLVARLLLAGLLTIVVFIVGTVCIWAFESGHQGGDIHGSQGCGFIPTGGASHA